MTSFPRVLFNGDSNFLFASDYRRDPSVPGPYTAQVIDDYVDRLADNGVEAFVINGNAQVPWYPSRRLDHVLTGYYRGNREHAGSVYPPVGPDFSAQQRERAVDSAVAMLDRFLDLAEQGVDWVRRAAQRCRERGISPWSSVRMNDAHGSNNWEGCYFNSPPQRDPRLRLSGKTLSGKGVNRYMTVCNYEHREVRDYYYTMIQELLEDYDFDGLELDWLRCPVCCDPPASQATIDLIVQWHRAIRDLVDQAAKRRGKPIPFGLRVPARLGMLRTNGLEVVAMARQGIIDFVGFSNFWQTTWDLPYDRYRALLGERVKIFGLIEDAPNWMFALEPRSGARGYRLLTASPELIRGNAAGKLACGVDAIEFYNFFCTDSGNKRTPDDPSFARYDAIPGAADLDFLRGKPKHYALATSFNYWSMPAFESADQVPATLEHGAWRRFEIAMCAEPSTTLELVAQVIVEADASLPDDGIGVSLNGSWPTFDAEATDRLLLPTGKYTHHVPEHRGLNFRLDPGLIVDGLNELTVWHGGEPAMPHDRTTRPGVRIIGVELALREP